jgi:membrane protease YdiL (CAAX protease family)
MSEATAGDTQSTTGSPDDDTSTNRWYRRLKSILVTTGLSIAGLAVVSVIVLLIQAPIYFSQGEIGEGVGMVTQNIGLLLGAVFMGALIVRFTTRGRDYFDLSVPNSKEIAIAVITAAGLVALSQGVTVVFSLLGVESGSHGLVQQAESGAIPASVILLLVPLSILCIGPGEELLFRNIAQKWLYDEFSKGQAIGIASILFSITHLPVYFIGSTLLEASAALVNVLVLSSVLGLVYAHSEKIAVPAITHGVYNSILFAALYASITGAVGFL